MLIGGDEESRQGQFDLGSVPGAVADQDFAVDDGRADGLFSTPVGGINGGLAEEREQVVEIVLQIIGESVVDAPAVMNQHAGKIFAQQLDGQLTAACGVNYIASDLFRHEVVQSGAFAIHAPAGFIAHHSRRTTLAGAGRSCREMAGASSPAVGARQFVLQEMVMPNNRPTRRAEDADRAAPQ